MVRRRPIKLRIIKAVTHRLIGCNRPYPIEILCRKPRIPKVGVELEGVVGVAGLKTIAISAIVPIQLKLVLHHNRTCKCHTLIYPWQTFTIL